jgi:2-polyprenyl-6-methoxyphenol hydroxylase-like FAD-dependent oxidoreductase
MSDTTVTYSTAVIIGASAAGLATAACLKQSGVDYILLEPTGMLREIGIEAQRIAESIAAKQR